MSLVDFGWDERIGTEFDAHLEQAGLADEGFFLARVTFHSRKHYRVESETGTQETLLAGRLRKSADLPAVGDWVVVERPGATGAAPRIVDLLPRRTRLSRKVPGDRTTEQVVAANVDTVFIVMGLDGDFNLRRLERFAVMASQSGARAVVVLTKKDLRPDSAVAIGEATAVAPAAEIHAICAPDDDGLSPLADYLGRGQTVVMVGSSGAGKSTLLNALCGQNVMRTGDVREHDDRGRHTTTHRELVRLPNGGLLIDNPGIREVQLWSEDREALKDTFEDVRSLGAECRFRDCEHNREPGCAVHAAIDDGRLDAGRLEGMRALDRENRHLEQRRDDAARRKNERKQGSVYKTIQQSKRKDQS